MFLFKGKDGKLWDAAGSGDVESIRRLLQQGANVNWRNPKEWGHTPLHWAARDGCKDAVRALLEAGADVEAKDTLDGVTPLHIAAGKGHTDAVRVLLEVGADVGAKSKHGRTPLHIAAEHGNTDAVRALLEAGADIEAKQNAGDTPLHLAARCGRKDAVPALLEAGADAGAKNKDGWTPLHWAAYHGHKDAVPALLEAGADVGAKNKDGWTPLHQAACCGRKDAVRALLEAGTDVGAKNKDGWTPLHSAARNGHKDAVWALLEAGADVGAKTQDGWTPLHHAARYRHNDAVRALLEAGADVGAKNKSGKTPAEVTGTGLGVGESERRETLALLAAAASNPRPQPSPAAPAAHPAPQPPPPPRPVQRPSAAPQGASPSTSRPTVIQPATKPSAAAPSLAPPLSSSPALYTGGEVVLPAPLITTKGRTVVQALVQAGFQAAVQLASGGATCNPCVLVSVPLQLLQQLQAAFQNRSYCRERIQRVLARIAAMEPALRQLGAELTPPVHAGVTPNVVQSLCQSVLLLAQVLLALKALEQKLRRGGEGLLRRSMELLRAGGYREELDALEAELRECLAQLSTVLNIAHFGQVAEALRAQQELQVASWQQQNEGDRAADLQQLEGLMVEALGGVTALQQQLEEQRVVLDGQVVGLRQVAEWLQRMHAGNGAIVQYLQQMGQQLAGIDEQVGVVRTDVGVVKDTVLGLDGRLDSLQDELSKLLSFMAQKGKSPSASAPAIIIPRSHIVLPAGALASGTSGAFGTVVKATRDGGEVALKVYNHRTLGDIDSEDAMAEALLLSKANHHNVVRCFGLVNDPDTTEGTSLHGSLVMEWVGGGNLYKWLQSNRSTSLLVRVQLGLQVAAGMRHLHERKLVHGDLKPQNVLLTASLPGAGVPQAKICDFGLAKHTSTSVQHSYKQTKAYTPAYTSPERISNYRRTTQDDVYAFGILLFFIMTSRAPFPHIPAEWLRDAVLRGERPDVSAWANQQRREGGPASWQQAVTDVADLAAQCWSAEAGQRPAIQAVHATLSSVLVRMGG